MLDFTVQTTEIIFSQLPTEIVSSNLELLSNSLVSSLIPNQKITYILREVIMKLT